MNAAAKAIQPDLHELLGLFPNFNDFHGYEFVPASEVPFPYNLLLVHEHHMTVTVEAHHDSPVDVVILDRRLEGDFYSRRILLALHSTGKIVQYGIVRINLSFCSEAVRDAILKGDTPLGRILIQHNVLRRIEPTAFLRVIPGPELTRIFQLPLPTPTYGRLAIIHCDNLPAIELLEVVAPEAPIANGTAH